MAIDPDDEFFGDQSSGSESPTSSHKDIGELTPSDPFGNASNHEYRSREASVRTLSYLDGYDETKEEKLQDGFANGYEQSFNDAYSVGRRLGSLCAQAALNESITLGLSDNSSSTTSEDSNQGFTRSIIEKPATLVRQFLTEEILIDGKGQPENRYDDALLKLKEQLTKILDMICNN